MAREGKSRQAPPPTSITEVARRYHAAAVALSQTFGLPLEEVLREHRESVTAIFIESGRCELRLPASVTLPPVHEGTSTPEAGQEGTDVSDMSANANGHAIPTCIPADGDLPCRGQEIARLTPPQLAMLLAKVARRVQDGADGWIPLLHALQGERQARIARARVTGTKKPRAMARRPWAVPDAAPPG
jgi:hypothetical protein